MIGQIRKIGVQNGKTEQRRADALLFTQSRGKIRQGLPHHADTLTDLERRYDKVLSSLSSEDMDTVCDSVSLLQEIDDRELEIACQNMVYRFEKL